MSSHIHNLNIRKILERVAGVIGVDKKKNQEIAKALGVEPQTCSNWKNKDRKTIPWAKLFVFSIEKNASLDYLLTGKHSPAKEPEDKPWTFSEKAKTKYSRLSRIVEDANEAVEINDASLLISTLIGVAERLKNIEGEKKTVNG